MPYYMTNTGRALVLENYEISQFDLKNSDSATIKVLGSEMRGRLMQGDAPLDLIESFTEYSGRMEPLPDWMNSGAIIGMQGGTDKVKSVFAKLQELEAPIAAFWLQDWVGKRQTALGSQLWWNWVLDPKTYPGWSDMVAQLAAEDVRVMTYISPFLANVNESEEYEGGESLYETARDSDYLVKDSDGNPYLIPNSDFAAGLVDFTNPEAREWYKGIIKTNVIGMGATGYMAGKYLFRPPSSLYPNSKLTLWSTFQTSERHCRSKRFCLLEKAPKHTTTSILKNGRWSTKRQSLNWAERATLYTLHAVDIPKALVLLLLCGQVIKRQLGTNMMGSSRPSRHSCQVVFPV